MRTSTAETLRAQRKAKDLTQRTQGKTGNREKEKAGAGARSGAMAHSQEWLCHECPSGDWRSLVAAAATAGAQARLAMLAVWGLVLATAWGLRLGRLIFGIRGRRGGRRGRRLSPPRSDCRIRRRRLFSAYREIRFFCPARRRCRRRCRACWNLRGAGRWRSANGGCIRRLPARSGRGWWRAGLGRAHLRGRAPTVGEVLSSCGRGSDRLLFFGPGARKTARRE